MFNRNKSRREILQDLSQTTSLSHARNHVVKGRHSSSRAVLPIPHKGALPGDPGCCRRGCWAVHHPGTKPETRTLSQSHSHTRGECQTTDRRESGIITGPWFCPTWEQTSTTLHVTRSPFSPNPVVLAPVPAKGPRGCTTSLTPLWRRPKDSGPMWARLRGLRALVRAWVWPWEPRHSYLAQAGGAVGFLYKNQSAFPLVVWLPLRCETLPSSMIVPSSSNVAQSASSRA